MRIHGAILATALAFVCGCSGVERSSSPVGPTTSTNSPTPGVSTPSLLGTWSSNTVAGLSPSSCANFSWHVTSQTATSVSGTFSASCANGVSVSGTASGQISGSDLPYTISGTASTSAFPSCAFFISGTARIVDSNTLRIPYLGSTCFGPVSGEETLRRASSASTNFTGANP